MHYVFNMCFSEYLCEIYELKKRKNKNFSLRAFSRFVGISSGRLSEIMNGKAGVKLTTAKKIAEKLCLDSEEEKYFLNLAISEFSTNKENAHQAKLEIIKSEYMQIDSTICEVVSDWRCLAILEVLKISKIHAGNISSLSIELGETNEFVFSALSKLQRNGQIDINSEGCYVATHRYLVTQNDIPSSSVRNCHKNLLLKSIDSLEKQDMSKRDHNSSILSVSDDDIDFIKKEIDEFLNILVKKIESTQKGKDKVYSLNISLFELLKKIEG